MYSKFAYILYPVGCFWVGLYDQVAEQGIFVNTRSPCYNTYHLCQMMKCMPLYTYNGDLLKLKFPELTYMHTFT